MNGADFALETRAEDGEDPRGLEQYAPEALRIFRVVGLVRVVFLKGDAIGNFAGHRPDADRGLKAVEREHDLAVEGGDGHGRERDATAFAVVGLEEQIVTEKSKSISSVRLP